MPACVLWWSEAIRRWLTAVSLVLRYNLQYSEEHTFCPGHPEDRFYTQFYLIFITAAQWEGTREKGPVFNSFLPWCGRCSDHSDSEKSEQAGRGEKKGKTECLASFALFIFFLYSLNLNIIFLSVYLNFCWIKREWEDVNNWNRPQIVKTAALAVLPNHRGHRFL